MIHYIITNLGHKKEIKSETIARKDFEKPWISNELKNYIIRF